MSICGIHTLTLVAYHGLDQYGRSGYLDPDIKPKHPNFGALEGPWLVVSTGRSRLMVGLAPVAGMESG